ncbi:hypothetical protein [Vibrio renipiscarius]|uniref:Uncharacterized protein n=1 Tax=Vibrio renipiscarius TaxID=1461322 RepID=A0A0C2NX37_9VIBR|nr:hypothetical protein [Vibrio renipiscarius]KII75315.1 hypothetical protein OJ16_18660 [Vibrio renipiscarius]KII78767.1 hypothetical protein PL18_10770 [Vibrio renipiscarius]
MKLLLIVAISFVSTVSMASSNKCDGLSDFTYAELNEIIPSGKLNYQCGMFYLVKFEHVNRIEVYDLSQMPNLTYRVYP